jgi:putative oxidoreductase
MKTTALVIRILLGLTFTVFGLNGFLHFIPQPTPSAQAANFFGALFATGYMIPLIFATQLISGLLLLIGFVPLGLILLAPVLVNIFLFHAFLEPHGLPLAVVIVAMELFLAWRYQDALAPLFTQRA